MDSKRIRMQVAARRSQLSAHCREQVSDAITSCLQQLPQVRQAQTIAAYIAIAEEVSLAQSIGLFHRQGKRVLLPCIDVSEVGAMVFTPYEYNAHLEVAGFGVSQPEVGEQVPVDTIDVVVVPLLAFTSSCHRVGWGRGYYDRFFALRKQQPAPPWLIGVGFSCQQEEQIDPKPWDVQLDMVVTESRVFTRRK